MTLHDTHLPINAYERVPGHLGFHREPPDVSPQRAENRAIEEEINARLRDFPGVMAFSGEDSVELDVEWEITTDKHDNRRHVLEELRDRAQHLADDLQALLDGRQECQAKKG